MQFGSIPVTTYVISICNDLFNYILHPIGGLHYIGPRALVLTSFPTLYEYIIFTCVCVKAGGHARGYSDVRNHTFRLSCLYPSYIPPLLSLSLSLLHSASPLSIPPTFRISSLYPSYIPHLLSLSLLQSASPLSIPPTVRLSSLYPSYIPHLLSLSIPPTVRLSSLYRSYILPLLSLSLSLLQSASPLSIPPTFRISSLSPSYIPTPLSLSLLHSASPLSIPPTFQLPFLYPSYSPHLLSLYPSYSPHLLSLYPSYIPPLLSLSLLQSASPLCIPPTFCLSSLHPSFLGTIVPFRVESASIMVKSHIFCHSQSVPNVCPHLTCILLL